MKVLFIDIDTLRPDHMGCYGYWRNTTPCLDSIAKDGTLFTECYTSDAPCLPSRAALISGRLGIRNGAVGHGDTTADRRLTGKGRPFKDTQDTQNFTNIFRHAGMHTCSVSTFGERHSSYWFHAGFNEIYDVGEGGHETADQIIPIAIDWLDRNKSLKDWYLHVHIWDPHTPYRTPAGYPDLFSDSPFTDWITQQVFDTHKNRSGPHSLLDLHMYDDKVNPKYPKMPGKITEYEQLRDLMDGYDLGVRYGDDQISRLINRLKDMGIYDDTAIIVTADHGETMGEMGIYAEHGVADRAVCRIPLIIKWPGIAGGQVDRMLHYQLDLNPTMADLLGVPKEESWDGCSFAESMQGRKAPVRENLVISQMTHVCQRSAVFGDWLYIRTIHDGYHLFDKEMLFNLKDDPHEQQDVKALYPDICAKGARIILDWTEENMLKSDSDADPMWTVIREDGPFHTHCDLNAYLQRLEQTGRADGADQIRKKYGL